MVDSANQIIVAAEVTNQANDEQQAVPMARAALDNLEAAEIERPKTADGTPVLIPNTADNGYFSEKALEELEELGMDPHVVTGRQEHHEVPAPVVAGEPTLAATATEKMRHELRSTTGKLLYAALEHIVEPVFGQIKGARGIRRFLMRGLEKVSAEWQLICSTHNLLKIWRRASVGATSRGSGARRGLGRGRKVQSPARAGAIAGVQTNIRTGS